MEREHPAPHHPVADRPTLQRPQQLRPVVDITPVRPLLPRALQLQLQARSLARARFIQAARALVP